MPKCSCGAELTIEPSGTTALPDKRQICNKCWLILTRYGLVLERDSWGDISGGFRFVDPGDAAQALRRAYEEGFQAGLNADPLTYDVPQAQQLRITVEESEREGR